MPGNGSVPAEAARVWFKLRYIQPKGADGLGSEPITLPPASSTRCASSGKQVCAPPNGGEITSPVKHRSSGFSCSSNATTSVWLSGNHAGRVTEPQVWTPLTPDGMVFESRQTTRLVPPVKAPPLM